MGLETALYIDQLNASNPLAVDPKSQGDDHLRLIKTVLQTQFPYLGEAAVNTTAAQINVLTEITEGRVLAGYDSADGDFAAGATDGSKTHSMTTAEMPAHTHNVTAMALTSGSINTTGSAVRYSEQSLTTSSTGSGNAFNIMQPYQVVYMWTRTA